MKITFLGTGDSLGTPRVYCDCAVCEEARADGVNRRLRSSLWLEAEGEPPLLLDCGPDFRAQTEALGVRRVEQALITHAHIDHIGGLPDWADACRWLGAPADCGAPAEVIGTIVQRFPWIVNQIALRANDGGGRYGDWSYLTWKVNHGRNGYSFAYRFDHPSTGVAWAYCPDAIDLTAEQILPLCGLQLLVLGTSFAEERAPRAGRSVYDMKEAAELLERIKPRAAVYTHLSHDIDLRRDYRLPAHVRLARTGMRLTL